LSGKINLRGAQLQNNRTRPSAAQQLPGMLGQSTLQIQ
jgi:hypothetical protein